MRTQYVMVKRLLFAVVLTLLLNSSPAFLAAQMPGDDAIGIWGHGHRGRDYIGALLHAWQEAYQKTHPEVKFDDELDGNASAMGGLWTGKADLAILDREASFIEIDGYQQGTGHDPFRIAVARGSVGMKHHAPALVVYVNKANPLLKLSMAQLDGIFDVDHRLNDRRLRTWVDVGLSGEWVDQPIHLYTLPIESAPVQFFERAAMKGSQKFSGNLKIEASEAQIAAAVAADRYGLALSDEPAKDLKPVPLAVTDGVDAVLPTEESISLGSYPLARTVYIYANKKKGEPVPPKVAGFLRFIVSDEGQALIRAGGYLPLPQEMVATSREALK